MSGKIRLLVAVLLLALAVVSCGGSTSTYTISGTVSSSGAGLQGVMVTLSSASTATFTTDALGNFAFQNVTKGTYTITPTRTGYTFSPSTLTAEIDGANAAGQNFIVAAAAPALNCAAGHGPGTNGIQFNDYGGIVALDSTAVANAPESSSLTWQVLYQNIYSFPATAYSGSLRTRVWAVPYSVSSCVFDNAYILGVFYPNFTGTGAASSNQLYVGSLSQIQIANSTAYNPPAGEYCIVVTLEEYNENTAYCTSPDHYCVNDYWQYGNSWVFY